MLEILRTSASCSRLPRASRKDSSSTETSKWSSMAFLPRPVTRMMLSTPDSTASSTPYWMIGLSTSGSISFGCALVAGRNRVPRPAAGNTALRTTDATDRHGSRGLATNANIEGVRGSMLDPAFVRDHLETVRTGLKNRGLDVDKSLEEI